MPLLPLFILPFMTLHLPPQGSFASQTVIITGANTGIGLETARNIVSLRAAKVILGVRSIPKGRVASADIEASIGRSGIIEVWELDLESFDSVKSFASRATRLERLDAGIMNAGVATMQWNLSTSGFERQLQVNVLSTNLLSLLLPPLLVVTNRAIPSTNPHLVVVESDIHIDAKFRERTAENILDTLNDKETWKTTSSDPSERYAVTKLLDLCIAIELAQLVPTFDGDPAVIVNVISPGFCKSELLSREDGAPWILKAMQALTARTLPEGSKTIVDAVVRGKEAHGKYLDHQKVTIPGDLVTSDEGIRVRTKLWGDMLQVLMGVAPEINQVTSRDL